MYVSVDTGLALCLKDRHRRNADDVPLLLPAEPVAAQDDGERLIERHAAEPERHAAGDKLVGDNVHIALVRDQAEDVVNVCVAEVDGDPLTVHPRAALVGVVADRSGQRCLSLCAGDRGRKLRLLRLALLDSGGRELPDEVSAAHANQFAAGTYEVGHNAYATLRIDERGDSADGALELGGVELTLEFGGERRVLNQERGPVVGPGEREVGCTLGEGHLDAVHVAIVLVGHIAHLIRGRSRTRRGGRITGSRVGGGSLGNESVGRFARNADLYGSLVAAHRITGALRKVYGNVRGASAILIGRNGEDVANLPIVDRDRAGRPREGGVGKVEQQPMRPLMLRDRVADGAVGHHANDGLLRRLLHEDVADNPLV